MPKACINFGHGPMNGGGFDPGAVAPDGYQEAVETREVGSKVVAKLKANGWDVLAIQDGDLVDVTNQSNAFKSDYFISIHTNSYSDPTAHGVETYALQSGGPGNTIAKEIQKDLLLATGLTDRGVKFAGLWVLRKTDCPAVLVEIGFISNPAEEALMKQDSWDDKVASAICKGFSRAVGVGYKEGGNDVLDVAVLLFTDEDYWSGKDVAIKNGNCAMFIRPTNQLIPSFKAMGAKHLIVVGGGTTGHPNETLLSGLTKYDTATVVGKYLG